MKLHTLLKALPSFKDEIVENPDIISVENDNRKIKEGSLFICIKGYTVDGHQFAADAVKKGAVAVVAERPVEVDVPVIIVKDTMRTMAILADTFYHHPTQRLRLIGITGTNGKTTTSHLIEKIFNDHHQKTGLIGTMYTKIGESIKETKNTTPDSVTLQKIFAEMIDEQVETAIMEVSSHALELGRVHGCDYDIAVFTNLTQDHLDFHKTMERYKFAKSLLFSQLGNTFVDGRQKFAVLNADDPASEDFKKWTAAHVLTYGIDNDADVLAKNILITSSGTQFSLVTPFGELDVRMKLIGKFSVYNVLAAISVSICSGLPLASIVQSIEDVKGVSGRFEAVDAGQDFSVIVDYAHTPDSLENVLRTVKDFAKNRITVIVGCGGDRDKTKRPLMAQIACEFADKAIFTSDNPRSEDPLEILKDMEAGVQGKPYQLIPDRKDAIFHAINGAQTGEVIVIAGKGHETYQQIGDKIFDFDDRVVSLEAIKNKKSK
ncbi:UDP-N-acetylmuramoyl-L-alanyl-D-glutamate--2,6-diaminopimelate ligase [Peribacillus alkalitolerans]|uniref:UDP-N-acetylmuramoyl-L-alanyl-D-glutamate--2, 6-diaminopimelate ligase n=1 Tax=Peribacillus alkalitolerans TaxID=1550385 RepID=UPI0013D81E9A|nr:UDP-N-acetylmuramoyl-L-alanyl-D-glutamate--2,6-diaminopimelate ligase [Peribacillus alkalitolerans]